MLYLFKITKRQFIYSILNIGTFGCLLILISLIVLSKKYPLPDPYIQPLSKILTSPNCSNLFLENSDPTVFKAAESWTIPDDETFTDLEILQKVKANCRNFLQYRNYFLKSPNNDEEKKFPIAFSIIIFKTGSQVEQLLRTIYRPWNYYCIHIDLKANELFTLAINELVNCLNENYGNIISIKNRTVVEWGEMSVLNADLKCMRELYERYKKWKYFINLTGQEFPLKTNWELVKILTAFKGANNVDGTYRNRDEIRIPTMAIPFPVVWYKGSVHITVNRHFVRFAILASQSQMMLKALTNALVPDEQFFSTLNYNPYFRIPGSFIGDPDDYSGQKFNFFITRYKNRGEYSCISKQTVRGLCIWGAGDLPKLVQVPHLFSNKFYEDFQPITLKCLEKWYYDKVDLENQINKTTVNETFYRLLPFVKYRFVPHVD